MADDKIYLMCDHNRYENTPGTASALTSARLARVSLRSYRADFALFWRGGPVSSGTKRAINAINQRLAAIANGDARTHEVGAITERETPIRVGET
jgi:hypothetical protein